MYIQIQVSVPSSDIADQISAELLNSLLAACVQTLGPITSQYRWENSLHRDEEYLLLIKAPESLFKEICKVITSLHPYELPEIIYSSINGTDGYLQWIAKSCRSN